MQMKTLRERAQVYAESALSELRECSSTTQIEAFYASHLGKKGQLKALRNELKTLTPDEKRDAGGALSAMQKELESAFAAQQKEIKKATLDAQLATEWLDVTQQVPRNTGSIHPLNIVQKQVEDVFMQMGYTIADGPEIETEWHNFDALNVPQHHPARDMQDTFWVGRDSQNPLENYVLRTQTSNAQIRMLKEHGAPMRMICPGRVFRNEATDATHDSVFYQVEGLVVDRGISLSHLKGTVEVMLRELFNDDTKVRFRPGFFPFVEPGLEVDMWWEYTDKKGQKQGKWLEFMGAGMVHSHVLESCGLDPNEVSGFAFGFGLTRLVMMRYGIEDIRHLFGTKPRFLQQFA